MTDVLFWVELVLLITSSQ